MASVRHALQLLLSALLLAASGAGCATAVAPSLPQARRPTPTTVTRDNPAGDAKAPEDAALTRLLEAPEGKKIDKFRTLLVRLPDARKWRRVRLWGQPTRATFRYGDDHYAVAVIDYRDAEGDDEPTRCLERFITQGRRKAEAFDIELGTLERSVSRHWRGVESVDWIAHEAKRKKRSAERRKKLAARRKKLAARRKKVHELRKKLAAAKKRPFKGLGRRKPSSKNPSSKNSSGKNPSSKNPSGKNAGGKAQTPQPTPSIGKRLKRFEHKLLRLRAHLRKIRRPTQQRRVDNLKRRLRLRRLRHGKPQLARIKRDPNKPRHGYADMPVIRATGKFSTLFKRDQYVGAIVAYRSWPGSCLVHGLAVRVGTDEALAKKVIERWLSELAPRLRWGMHLRKRPEYKNR